MNPRLVVVGLILLYGAAVLDVAFSRSSWLFGSRPDFVLATSLSLALLSRPAGASVAGFLGGLLEGAMAGANLTAYLISRVIGGLVMSAIPRLGITVNAATGFLFGGLGTFLTKFILVLLAPRPDLSSILGSTIGSAIYNGVIASILCGVLGHLEKSSSR